MTLLDFKGWSIGFGQRGDKSPRKGMPPDYRTVKNHHARVKRLLRVNRAKRIHPLPLIVQIYLDAGHWTRRARSGDL